jgi:hypothetical protein
MVLQTTKGMKSCITRATILLGPWIHDLEKGGAVQGEGHQVLSGFLIPDLRMRTLSRSRDIKDGGALSTRNVTLTYYRSNGREYAQVVRLAQLK